MKRRICLWMLPFWCVVCWANGAAGATLNGRLTTSAYSWQVREADGTTSRHLRAYQSVIANIRRAGEPLSFHTYAQFSGDLLDGAPGQRDYRIYHAYLQWRPKGALGLDVTAGRQRIYGGVGFGTIDGVRLQAAPHPWVRMVSYAGMLVPLVPDEGVGTWDEGHLWGAQALVEVKQTVLGISFAERAREPLAYLGPGRFSELRFKNGSKQFRRLGVDLRQEVGERLEVHGRVDLDLDAADVQEVELTGQVQATPELRISAGFQHRKPSLYLNSILSVFEVSTNQEVEGRIFYRLNALLGLSADVSRVYYDDDSSWRAGAGILVGNGYVGYSRRVGYGGESNAFTATLQHPLTPKLTLKANGSVSGYRLYREQPTQDRALAGSLGVAYRPRRTLFFDVETQVLRNKFYARDFRFFVRGSIWFFKRG